MSSTAEFYEETARARVESVPLSHLSIEVGHLYSEDYDRDDEALREYFARIATWTRTARELAAAELDGRTPRVSTCFLVDDYFGRFGGPGEVVPRLEKLAAAADLRIDYLARESACAAVGPQQPARVVEQRIVAEPAPGDNGSRPAATVSGWLSNGQRSPKPDNSAMALREPWRPPREHAARRHSIFMDVELWNDDDDGTRTWSCAFLAAVWQLLRLGLVRDRGAAMAQPVERPDSWPDSWQELPAVIRLARQAPPFCAYRAMSIMDNRFGNVEQAVRVILSQIDVQSEIAEQLSQRASGEKLSLPGEIVDRLEYVLTRGVT